ncbi:MAG: UDP-2,3-diacylglucosamine diphosphatase [Pseudomonadota bacterium]
MGETLVLADLHLSEDKPEIIERFLALENRLLHADALYILGDFVEVWVGDDAPIPEALAPALALLARLTQAGVPVFFQHGNRDFLLGNTLARRIGMRLLPERKIAEFYGHRVALLHGDTLCTDDLAYQSMRRKLRNPLSLFVLRHLPLGMRLKLASRLRERSKQAIGQKGASIMDVNAQMVEKTMRRLGINVMIHGHTHRAAIHRLHDGRLKHGLRAVLGDWEDAAVLLSVTSAGLSLERIEQRHVTQLYFEPWPRELEP